MGNNLTYLPESIENLKSLENLYILETNISSLPKTFCNLKLLNYICTEGSPIKTLSFITLKMLKWDSVTSIDTRYLTSKGERLYNENKWEELIEYYKKEPNQLALDYTADQKSLTEDELERLIHEAGKNEEILIENKLSLEDPVLRKIIERKSRKLTNGSKIFL